MRCFYNCNSIVITETRREELHFRFESVFLVRIATEAVSRFLVDPSRIRRRFGNAVRVYLLPNPTCGTTRRFVFIDSLQWSSNACQPFSFDRPPMSFLNVHRQVSPGRERRWRRIFQIPIPLVALGAVFRKLHGPDGSLSVFLFLL